MDRAWLYNNTKVDADDIKNYFGFVYMITNLETGKKYIGRKYIWSYRKQNKQSKRKKTESNWKDYYSSNKALAQIGKENPDILKREILYFCKSKGETNWRELEEIIKYNAIYDNNFLNDNLLGKYFRKNVSRYYSSS